jgi:beta-1,4-mannosyl-glycoprotein beta-1,4-N-acetylglucosaminyltransferase
VDQLKENTPQELRAMALARVENGGWHFSFYGMEEKAKEKIESFAHTEYDLEDYKDLEKILFRIENGIDPFDRFPLKYKEIDNSYPSFIKKKQIVL